MNNNRLSFPNGFEKTEVRWGKIKIKLAHNRKAEAIKIEFTPEHDFVCAVFKIEKSIDQNHDTVEIGININDKLEVDFVWNWISKGGTAVQYDRLRGHHLITKWFIENGFKLFDDNEPLNRHFILHSSQPEANKKWTDIESQPEIVGEQEEARGKEIQFNSEILGSQLYKNVIARAKMIYARGENKTLPADGLDVERYIDGYAACYKVMNQQTAHLQQQLKEAKEFSVWVSQRYFYVTKHLKWKKKDGITVSEYKGGSAQKLFTTDELFNQFLTVSGLAKCRHLKPKF